MQDSDLALAAHLLEHPGAQVTGSLDAVGGDIGRDLALTGFRALVDGDHRNARLVGGFHPGSSSGGILRDEDQHADVLDQQVFDLVDLLLAVVVGHGNHHFVASRFGGRLHAVKRRDVEKRLLVGHGDADHRLVLGNCCRRNEGHGASCAEKSAQHHALGCSYHNRFPPVKIMFRLWTRANQFD